MGTHLPDWASPAETILAATHLFSDIPSLHTMTTCCRSFTEHSHLLTQGLSGSLGLGSVGIPNTRESQNFLGITSPTPD